MADIRERAESNWRLLTIRARNYRIGIGTDKSVDDSPIQGQKALAATSSTDTHSAHPDPPELTVASSNDGGLNLQMLSNSHVCSHGMYDLGFFRRSAR